MSKKKKKKKTNLFARILGIFMALLMIASTLAGIFAYFL